MDFFCEYRRNRKKTGESTHYIATACKKRQEQSPSLLGGGGLWKEKRRQQNMENLPNFAQDRLQNFYSFN